MNTFFIDAMIERMESKYWRTALHAILSSKIGVSVEEIKVLADKVDKSGDDSDRIALLGIVGNSNGSCPELHKLVVQTSDTDEVRIASLPPLCSLYKRASDVDGHAIEQTIFEVLEQLGSSSMNSSTIRDVFCVNMEKASGMMVKSELTVAMMDAAWGNNYLFEMVAMPAFSRLIERGDDCTLQDVFGGLCEMNREPHEGVSLYFLNIVSGRIQRGEALKVEQRLLSRLALWEPAAIDLMSRKSVITWDAIVMMAETFQNLEKMPSTISFAQRMFCELMTNHRGFETWEDVVMMAAKFVSWNDMASLLEDSSEDEEQVIMLALASM